MSNALDVLIAARKRIENPNNWCRGGDAKTKDGNICSAGSDDAVAWCSVGAIKAEAAHFQIRQDANLFLWKAARTLFCECPVSVNDYGVNSRLGEKHKVVLEMYDHAIKLAQEQP